MERGEGVVEYVVRDLPSLSNAFALVEGPVDPEVDAALAVLLLGLRQRAEDAWDQRAHVAVRVARHAVPLVRHEHERDVVAAVEAPQGLEERAAEARVSRWVGREGRREVDAARDVA